MNYEQMEFDCRLDSERNLEDNIATVLAFAYNQLKDSNPKQVESRHEGYGLLVETYCDVQKALKAVGEGMKNYQKILPCANTNAIEAASSIRNSSAEAVTKIVMMEAQAERVMNDMYKIAGEEPTPLEDYAASLEADDPLEEVEEE